MYPEIRQSRVLALRIKAFFTAHGGERVSFIWETVGLLVVYNGVCRQFKKLKHLYAFLHGRLDQVDDGWYEYPRRRTDHAFTAYNPFPFSRLIAGGYPRHIQSIDSI